MLTNKERQDIGNQVMDTFVAALKPYVQNVRLTAKRAEDEVITINKDLLTPEEIARASKKSVVEALRVS